MEERYFTTRAHEFETTKRVLMQFPDSKLDLKPGEKSKTARELAWVFVVEERLMQKLMTGGEPDFSARPPETMAEILEELEREHAKTDAIIKNMRPEEFREGAMFFVAPKTPGKIPKGDLLWMLLLDSIHHRGQFSVYSRIAGAKVPSIYGPSADEPWN
jgi:uncharacterized damage-inducible protein DinB